jgi:hypothetical protein
MESIKKNWQPVVIGLGILLGGILMYKLSQFEECPITTFIKKRGPFQTVVSGTVNWEAS